MAAVPGAEWRVPLWNTAGFEPRREARLRRTANCYSRHRFLRHLVLSSSFISVFHPSSPSRLLLLCSPRNIGAVLLLPPATSSYPLPILRRQQRRRRCSHFSSKALPAHCSSSNAIGKMDRRKKAGAGSRDREGETMFILFSG